MSLVTERSGDASGPISAEPETSPARTESAERRIPIGMVLGRLVAIPVSILVVASISFWLVRASGTTASSQLAGEYATPEQIAAVQETLGLNRSMWAQYGDFLGSLVRGDLGTSYFTTRPVTDEIFDRLPLDLTIGVLALLVAAVVGIAFGAVGAYFRSRWPDRSTRIVISVLQSFPDYVLALVLIYVLFFKLGVFPAPIGQISLFAVPPPDVTGVVAIDALLAGQWSMFGSALEQLALPVLAYGLVLSAVFAKVTRSAFAGALSSGQIQYARACGLTPRRVFWSAFTVSRTSILTTVAIVTGAIVGGGAIMQKIFNLDGAAAFGVDSIFKYDLPVIQGIVIVFGAITIVVFLLVDIAILLLDPRVRHQR